MTQVGYHVTVRDVVLCRHLRLTALR